MFYVSWIVGALLLPTALLVGCSRQRSGIEVTSTQYGDQWPFTIASGRLQCDRESSRSARLLVTLDTDDHVSYGLNGSAIDFGFPDAKSILKSGRTGADVQPLIALGLTLCEARD